VLLPQAVYPTENRDALLAVTGAQVYGYIPLGPVGQLEYRAYGGTIFIDNPRQSPNAAIALEEIKVPYVFGGRAMWLPPLEGLQLGASFQVLRFDVDFSLAPETKAQLVGAGVLPMDFDGKGTIRSPLQLWVTSIEWSPFAELACGRS